MSRTSQPLPVPRECVSSRPSIFPKTLFAMLLIALVIIAAPKVVAQNIEVTPFIGGQANGGLDLSTTIFRRIEVKNGLNYGVSLGYLLGEHGGVEFMWNHNKADTVAQFTGGGSELKVFGLNTNQYLGNFLYHFSDRQTPLRPFVLLGLGATSLSPDRDGVNSITRFAWALGAGAKYNFTPRLGVRVQGKWSPTYVTSTTDGFWCDPFWGGCWAVGNDHFLHEFDFTGGVTFRF